MPARTCWLLAHVHMQVVFESPEAQLADTAALQLTAAGIYTTYTLKQTKNVDLGACRVPTYGGRGRTRP